MSLKVYDKRFKQNRALIFIKRKNYKTVINYVHCVHIIDTRIIYKSHA